MVLPSFVTGLRCGLIQEVEWMLRPSSNSIRFGRLNGSKEAQWLTTISIDPLSSGLGNERRRASALLGHRQD